MNTKRKINLFGIALTFHACRLFYKRDPKLWVFGAQAGKKYDDNAKYLFEHVNNYHPNEVRAVWLAEREEVVNDARESGGEAYTFNSKEGKRIAHKAGVAIYSHALSDFGLWPQVGGAKLVFLGHGVGFKKTYNAKRAGINLLIKNILDKFFSWIQRDITISTSKYNQIQRKNIAGLKDCSNIYITGQPRNDILKGCVDRVETLKNIGVDSSKKVILYMPTYRNPMFGKDTMVDIVHDLYENQSLHDVLDKGNFVFIAKLHPQTPHIDLQPKDNFMILDYKAVKANQELLAIGDILVTDFSSCCVDFALLNRPVIFYVPDERWFVKHSEPVCDEFYDISAKNKCVDADGLAKKIEEPSLSATNAINELFEDSSIKGTCYSENVYKAIRRSINHMGTWLYIALLFSLASCASFPYMYHVAGTYKKQTAQGMAVYGDKAFLANNTGICRIFDMKADSTISSFQFAGAHKNNHSNCLDFGIEFPLDNQQYPALYISECLQHGRCFVESVKDDKSTLLQTLSFNRHVTNWFVDRENKKLYAMAHLVRSGHMTDSVSFYRFPLPSIYDGDLDMSDKIESVFHVHIPYVLQGGTIHQGKLYLPVGVNKGNKTVQNNTRMLLVVNLKKGLIEQRIDLARLTSNEPEDVYFYRGRLLLFCGQEGGLYPIKVK